MLEPGCWDERFGLRVTLNSIDPDALRSIDRKRLDANVRHSRDQTSQATSISGFGFDIERDLLRAASGTPIDSSLGTRMSGADALSVSARTTASQLLSLLSQYLVQYHSKAYLERFDWVDQISEVTDPIRQAELDRRLTDKLRSSDFDKLFMCPPEIIDWSRVSHYQYAQSANAVIHDDIHVSSLLLSLRSRERLTISTLQNKRVYCLDSDDNVLAKWTAYKCLQCELPLDGHTYLLSGGTWYRIANDFVDQVNRDVACVPDWPASLPDFQPSDADEAGYNKRVAADSKGRLELMDAPDKKILHGGGKSRIEFCDLFSPTRQLIHVKRYRSSKDLSHLFAQGRVSGELLLTSAEFRHKVNQKVGASHQLSAPEARPDPTSFEIVFAIISKSDKPLAVSLPFFSKVSLRHVVRQLKDALAYRVFLTKVKVASLEHQAGVASSVARSA